MVGIMLAAGRFNAAELCTDSILGEAIFTPMEAAAKAATGAFDKHLHNVKIEAEKRPSIPWSFHFLISSLIAPFLTDF